MTRRGARRLSASSALEADIKPAVARAGLGLRDHPVGQVGTHNTAAGPDGVGGRERDEAGAAGDVEYAFTGREPGECEEGGLRRGEPPLPRLLVQVCGLAPSRIAGRAAAGGVHRASGLSRRDDADRAMACLYAPEHVEKRAVGVALVQHALHVGFRRVVFDVNDIADVEIARRRLTHAEQRAIVVVRLDLDPNLLPDCRASPPS